MSAEYRRERDSLGEIEVPADRYYGAQTARALAIAQGLTASDLRAVPWAYPTATSDLKPMLTDLKA